MTQPSPAHSGPRSDPSELDVSEAFALALRLGVPQVERWCRNHGYRVSSGALDRLLALAGDRGCLALTKLDALLDGSDAAPVSDVMTYGEVARELRVSVRTVIRMAEDGRLPKLTFGASTRFLRADVERLKAESRTAA